LTVLARTARTDSLVFWHAFKVLRGAAIFTGFYLSGPLVGVLVFPLIAVVSPDPLKRIRRCQAFLGRCFTLTTDFLRWFRIFSFDARRARVELPDRPLILVANHPSTLDVVATLATFRACVVVKRKIWDYWLLRSMFRWCGYIDGGDGTMESNQRVLDQVKERLAQGFNVVIFPEGGRSPPNSLRPLAKGAFAIASSTGTDLLPVFIHCDPPALTKEWPWHRLPAGLIRYEIGTGEVVSGTNTSARKLKKLFTTLYQTRLMLRTQGSPQEAGQNSG
jgi:1-acyl-sn-glycerol-3-phosphate acyltransferase